MIHFTLTPSHIEAFLLIFLRIGAILCVAPIFGSPRIPLPLRLGLSALLAFLLQPLIAPRGFAVSDSFIAFLLPALREVAVGLLIGYAAGLIFSIVEMAGALLDMQAGFSLANVVDPGTEQPGAILGQFQLALMWLIFLAVNGHLLLLQAVTDSFRLAPLGAYQYAAAQTTTMLQFVTTMMFIALRISAPVLGAVLLADLAMGAVQRAAPQLNIIAVGLPAKTTVALIALSLALPFMLTAQRDLVPLMGTMIHRMLTF